MMNFRNMVKLTDEDKPRHHSASQNLPSLSCHQYKSKLYILISVIRKLRYLIKNS